VTAAAASARPAEPPEFAAQVVAWQQTHGRSTLPWQNTRDPYRVWLSEVMLQQTRVPVVIDYYSRWMERWPTVETLAAATQEVKPGDRDSCARKIQSLIHSLLVEIEFLIR
jgi:A/G-specific adenine glycosylase